MIDTLRSYEYIVYVDVPECTFVCCLLAPRSTALSQVRGFGVGVGVGGLRGLIQLLYPNNIINNVPFMFAWDRGYSNSMFRSCRFVHWHAGCWS